MAYENDHKTLAIPQGWHFSESSRAGGVSYYILMSPTGIAGSEEIREDEIYAKPSPYARCSICSAPLDVPGRPWSRDCGGDCIACMADADPDDPDIGPAVAAMRAGEPLMKACRDFIDPFLHEFWEGDLGTDLNAKALALRDALPPEREEVDA